MVGAGAVEMLFLAGVPLSFSLSLFISLFSFCLFFVVFISCYRSQFLSRSIYNIIYLRCTYISTLYAWGNTRLSGKLQSFSTKNMKSVWKISLTRTNSGHFQYCSQSSFALVFAYTATKRAINSWNLGTGFGFCTIWAPTVLQL